MNTTPLTAYRQPPQGLITSRLLAWFSRWLSVSPKAGKARG